MFSPYIIFSNYSIIALYSIVFSRNILSLKLAIHSNNTILLKIYGIIIEIINYKRN